MWVTNPWLWRKTLRLNVERRTLDVARSSAMLRRTRKVGATSRALSVTTYQVAFFYDRRIAADVVNVALAGSAQLKRQSHLSAATASPMIVAPGTAMLQKARAAGFEKVDILISPKAAALAVNRRLYCSAAAITVTPQVAGLLNLRGKVDALSVDIVIAGQELLLKADRLLAGQVSPIAISPQAAAVRRGFRTMAAVRAIGMTPQGANLRHAHRIAAVARAAAVAGGSANLATSPEATIVSLSANQSGANQTSYSFASSTLGTAAADRYIIVGVVSSSSSGHTSVTVAGASATRIDTGGGSICSLWIVARPTGTSATIVFNSVDACTRCGIMWWAAYGLVSPVPRASASSGGGAMSIDGIQRGFVLAIARGQSNGTWSGVPETFDNEIEAGSTDRRTGGATQVGVLADLPAMSVNYSGSADRLVAVSLR